MPIFPLGDAPPIQLADWAARQNSWESLEGLRQLYVSLCHYERHVCDCRKHELQGKSQVVREPVPIISDSLQLLSRNFRPRNLQKHTKFRNEILRPDIYNNCRFYLQNACFKYDHSRHCKYLSEFRTQQHRPLPFKNPDY